MLIDILLIMVLDHPYPKPVREEIIYVSPR